MKAWLCSPGAVVRAVAVDPTALIKLVREDPMALIKLCRVDGSGDLDECTITEGKCMEVYGTQVGNKQCYNYHCGDTQISCPPKGMPVCPGGVNHCDKVPGTNKPYQMQKVSSQV